MATATIYPHLLSTDSPPTSREVTDTYRRLIDARIAAGSLRPLVLPYHLYGCLLLLIYLCIPHTKRSWVYAARWPVLAVILVFQWKTMWKTTSKSMATAFAAGLVSVWVMVFATSWLIFNRPQWDAKRVQRRSVAVRLANGEVEDVVANGHASTVGDAKGSRLNMLQEDHGLRNRAKEEQEQLQGNPTMSMSKADSTMSEKQGIEYYWQSYPDNLRERMPWTLEMLGNFRGPGWSWAIPPLPPLPPYILAQLGEPISSASKFGISSTGIKRYNNRQEVFNTLVPRFVIGCLLLDLGKVVLMKDPYFIFGPTTYALPPLLQNLSPFQLQFVRYAMTTFSVLISLEMAFMLSPLVVCLLCGPKVFGLRAEAWYYNSTWGSWYRVMDRGLNGLWGSWWHQSFRFVFAAPSNYLIREGYMEAHSFTAKIVALVCAFGISGFFHFGGSISQIPLTHPWHMVYFFMSQAVGVFLQTTVCAALRSQLKSLPRVVRQTGNFIFVFSWLFCTAWWLVDDFARGGIWLYEPIPISPLRGLGFGEKDAGWWCWQHVGVEWYRGKHWWDSGIAI